MSINATLFGQMLTFMLFAWFTMRYVWPLLENVLNERKAKIAEGLGAADRGHRELEQAHIKTSKELQEAREKALFIVNDAQKRATLILEEAKAEALAERNNILMVGQAQIESERNKAREELKSEVVKLALKGAEKILLRTIDLKDHRHLLNELVGEK
ncbi:MAG: atpF [Francisellaceae bacterium]|nr:atpF [Francisellaceae bacterium]